MQANPWKVVLNSISIGLAAGMFLFMAPGPVVAAVVEVAMSQMAFHPSHIKVKPGDRILFKNPDPFEHALEMVDAADPSHEILPETVVKGGATLTMPFKTRGVFILYCNNHGGMKAIVSTTGSFKLPKLALGRAQPREVNLGKKLSWSKTSPVACAKRHTVDNRGGKVGPNLTGIGAVYPPKFFVRAILNPSAEIATGFETTMVDTTDHRLITGIVVSDTEDKLVIRDARSAEGKLTTIPKSKIKRRKFQLPSMMPGNYADIMTVKQLSDILAYLGSLKV